jgi:hypothetical protein
VWSSLNHSLERKQGDTGVLHGLGCGIGSPVEASTIAPAAVRLNGRMGCGPSADPHGRTNRRRSSVMTSETCPVSCPHAGRREDSDPAPSHYSTLYRTTHRPGLDALKKN